MTDFGTIQVIFTAVFGVAMAGLGYALARSRAPSSSASPKSSDKSLTQYFAEIRRPIEGLLGSQDVFRSPAGAEFLPDYLEIVDHCARHVLERLNRLEFYEHLMSRKGLSKPTEFKLTEVFDFVFENIHRTFPGSDLQIEVKVARGLNGVKGHEVEFARLLQELVYNAVAYSPAKSCSVVLEPTAAGESSLRLSVTNAGTELTLAAFTAAHKGLGLSIVNAVVDLAGADVTVEFDHGSDEGIGVNRVSILFPKEFVTGVSQDPKAEPLRLNLKDLSRHFGDDRGLLQSTITNSQEQLKAAYGALLSAHQSADRDAIFKGLDGLNTIFAGLHFQAGQACVQALRALPDFQCVEFLGQLEDLHQIVESVQSDLGNFSKESLTAIPA
jgi:two-component sensor histidine kinase